MKRVTHFKAANRGLPVNITGSIENRDILLEFSFIWIVGWYLGVLVVAIEIHEMSLLSSYLEIMTSNCNL